MSGHPRSADPAATGAPKRRPRGPAPALAAALLCVTLPAVLAIAGAAAFYSGNRSTGFITVAGAERGYVLHVPAGHDGSRPAPLVISLHGGALWGGAQRDLSRWDELADREGFLVAYPSGQGRASPRAWAHGPGPKVARDVEFLTRLIDTLAARHNADRDRVYVNGLSNGGGMAFALSCAVPDRVAAVGIVAGAMTHSWEACAGAPPVPVLVIHGTRDPATPYHGGRTWVSPRPFPAVPDWVAQWAERNGCDEVPHDSAVTATVVRRAYSSCEHGADVVLYTLDADGHVWPGARGLPRWLVGTDSSGLDATEELWAFFRERAATPSASRHSSRSTPAGSIPSTRRAGR